MNINTDPKVTCATFSEAKCSKDKHICTEILIYSKKYISSKKQKKESCEITFFPCIHGNFITYFDKICLHWINSI